jgi:methionyl-tRNA formyltransferase
MRLIFAGTPAFAESALSSLADAGHEIALVLTRPDQPAGRGQRMQMSPVKQRALALGLAVSQPRTLRDASVQAQIAACRPEAMIVAAYGLILPPQVLAIPTLGCLNIHASLLPRWRGAAPIQRAIEAGDLQTGITIMQMDEGLDTGAIRLAASVPIGPQDTAGRLHDTLAQLGAKLIVQSLQRLAAGDLPLDPQPEQGVTYARRIDKSEAVIDWNEPAAVIERRLRAFDPFPAGLTTLEGSAQPIKLWRALSLPAPSGPAGEDQAPGTVLAVDATGITVMAGSRSRVLLTELQKPGGRRLCADEFLRGFPVAPGARLVAAGGHASGAAV